MPVKLNRRVFKLENVQNFNYRILTSAHFQISLKIFRRAELAATKEATVGC